ncbi:DoxX family membrane protein [Ectobacillus antri]|jgi:thiosulfate dehydrogenase [quinone] large subunit|uniref:DoxX family membrane protein n=1 Tax=Ectobacillus antri TaxID=2486280 RepID=A0ABT6HA56_9BACI|nr:DoxX family membrane protein [Ectobacillus antri]MDG4658566.1 DoxX family membrane protein [Ectobacillus antri]MDG5755570.1 DoxX family membrane protein [Ectobacillus antri]
MWAYLQRRGKKSIVFTLIRLYLGVKWTMAGYEKIKGGSFNATSFLKGALEKAKASGADVLVQDWWAVVIKYLFLPNVEILNYLIPVTELIIGIFLLTGSFTRRSLQYAIALNFLYLLSGSLHVNPQMIILSLFLLKVKENAATYGIDGWIFIPAMRKAAPPKPTSPPM